MKIVGCARSAILRILSEPARDEHVIQYLAEATRTLPRIEMTEWVFEPCVQNRKILVTAKIEKAIAVVIRLYIFINFGRSKGTMRSRNRGRGVEIAQEN